jgi:cytochrome c biogenesis protein CcmG/thiol:disulfide interchange protein DsbE
MFALALCGLIAACAERVPPPVKPAPAPPPVVVDAAPPPSEPAIEPHRSGPPSWIGVRFDKTATRVLRVIPGSPAETAGLLVGDEVIELDGKPAISAPNLVEQIRGRATGAKVAIVVLRAGKKVPLSLTLEARPDDQVLVKRALIDRPAPGFAAELVNGAYSATLADLTGQVVVVDFWATWCRPCAITMPYLDAWQAKYGPKGLRIVGLSSEELPDIQRFLAARPLGYTIARDAEAKIARDYFLLGVPMLVVIDRTGIVRHIQLGAADFTAVETAFTRLL